jgi:hypothetical protein
MIRGVWRLVGLRYKTDSHIKSDAKIDFDEIAAFAVI